MNDSHYAIKVTAVKTRQKYLGGNGNMALIYLRITSFQVPQPRFDFGNGSILYVLPYNLESRALIGAELLGLPFQKAESNIAA